MVELIYNLSLQNICKTKEVEEKNHVISSLAQKLERTVKHLEKIKNENVILQENISKIYISAKSECDKKNYKIYKLEKKLSKYIGGENDTKTHKKRKKEKQLEEKNDFKNRSQEKTIDDYHNEPKIHRKKRNKEEQKLREKNDFKNVSQEKIKDDYPDRKKRRIDEEIKDCRSRSVLRESSIRNTQSVQRDRYDVKEHRDYYRRSRSRSKERRRSLSSRDLRHNNHRDRSCGRSQSKERSRHSSRSKDFNTEDTFARETRLLLQKIRKTQEAGSSTSVESSPVVKRNFVKELNDKPDISPKNKEAVYDIQIISSGNKNQNCNSTENPAKDQRREENVLDMKDITSSESESNILEPNDSIEKENITNLEGEKETIEDSEKVVIEERNELSVENVSCDIRTIDNATSDVIDDEEISNDIFDELTQILNEIHEDQSVIEENETENDQKNESFSALSDMSIEEGEVDESSEEPTKTQELSPQLDKENIGSTSTLSDFSFDNEKISSKKEENNRKIILETISNIDSYKEIKITVNNNRVIEHKYHSRTKKQSKTNHQTKLHTKNKVRDKKFHRIKDNKSTKVIDNQPEFCKPMMKFEDPFNTKDWRDDPLTYVPTKWSDMRMYDGLEYVDDRKKKRASCDVEPIESSESNFGSQSSSFSPECPF